MATKIEQHLLQKQNRILEERSLELSAGLIWPNSLFGLLRESADLLIVIANLSTNCSTISHGLS